MINTKTFLENLLAGVESKNNIFIRNTLKEYLQILVLDFIYSHPKYSQLIFYGGSCLAHCYGLPRLSEDLDFVDVKKQIKISSLAKDLHDYFAKKTDLSLAVITQKFRIYLKFPLLHELKLSSTHETNLLFLKIGIFPGFIFCKSYQTAVIPVFKFNQSILIKTFDLPTLMATKIRAILFRKWEKTDKSGKTIIKVKGRDYFDLMWYLNKKIKPNISCIENVRNMTNLKEKLLGVIEKVDPKSIKLDLEPLIEDRNFVINLSKNIKNILKREISQI